MKWLQEKYEWLFYLLYVKFEAIYPKGAYPDNYAVLILHLPFIALVVFALKYFFPMLSRNQIAILCSLLSIPTMFYFSDERIEKIKKRYDK